MVILRGWVFLMSEVPLHVPRGAVFYTDGGSDCERGGNNFKGHKDLSWKIKAIIWPELPYVCHIRSAAGGVFCPKPRLDG